MQQKACCGKDIHLKLLNAHTKISFFSAFKRKWCCRKAYIIWKRISESGTITTECTIIWFTIYFRSSVETLLDDRRALPSVYLVRWLTFLLSCFYISINGSFHCSNSFYLVLDMDPKTTMFSVLVKVYHQREN